MYNARNNTFENLNFMDNILSGNPSLHLQGKLLEGNWLVEEIVPIGRSTTDGTGGNFTVAYRVKGKNGERAFLKALDYSRAMSSPHQSKILNAMTSAYLFECDVLEKCNKKYLDRVVRSLETGSILIDEPDAKGRVEYIIFELAEGDVRKHLKGFTEKFDTAWRLRSLQQIATGLKQLHTNSIAHQDLKPSNVLVFDKGISKIADLGRASLQGHTPQHDEFAVAGDPNYAPLDLAYGYVLPDWNERRLGCDFYHLGCMVVFFFAGVSMTTITLKYLDESFHPPYFGGSYRGSFEDILPYVRKAFNEAVEEFGNQINDLTLRNKLTEIVRQLCEPDISLRGHPQNRSSSGNSFSLERYLTIFDVLAKRAEAGIFKDTN